MVHRVGGSVEGHLAVSLDRLTTGRVELWQLTPSLAGFYLLGHEHGRQSLAQRLEQAEDEAARWFEIAHNPDAKAYNSMIQRRLDEAAENSPRQATEGADYARWLTAATTPRRAA